MTTETVNNIHSIQKSFELSNDEKNDEKYREILKLIHFNSKHDMIKKLISEIGIDYLSLPNPKIKDWGKDFPRYLHLYAEAFGEGHRLFNLLNESFGISLTDYQIIYLIICGIFWRYYYDTKIINYAIIELKNSEIYSRITKIPFTQELSKLLDDSGVSKKYSQFKRYGETLGYFNGQWLCDPSTYKEECKAIDKEYYKSLKC